MLRAGIRCYYRLRYMIISNWTVILAELNVLELVVLKARKSINNLYV